MFSNGTSPDSAVNYKNAGALCVPDATLNVEANKSNLTLPLNTPGCTQRISMTWVSKMTLWMAFLFDRAGLTFQPGTNCDDPLLLFNAVQQVANANVSGLVGVRVFTAGGTYTPTAGARNGIAIATGAGGGATGSPSNSGSAGGGAGATAIKFLSSLSAQTVSVGAPGAGGASPSFAGADGGASSFGALAVAGGGKGGAYTGSSPWPSGDGGIATAGDMLVKGGAGATAASYNVEGVVGGHGGSSFWGGGGAGSFIVNGGFLVNPGGEAGCAYGSGGGGSSADNSHTTPGGAGAQGVVIVFEFA